MTTWCAKGQVYNGNRVAAAPQCVAAGRVNYDVPAAGLQVGADAKYTGSTKVRPASDRETGVGHMTLDVGANYMTRIGGHDVTPRTAIDNLTNRRDRMLRYSDCIAPGDPRMVS